MTQRIAVLSLPLLLLSQLAASLQTRNQAEALVSLRQTIRSQTGLELPAIPIPMNNLLDPDKIALGETLFFDPNLSSCGSIACATCHLPDKGFSDGEKISDGCGGAEGRRNSNTIYNSAYSSHLFWDGRAQSLEEQALGPIVDPTEMANTWDNVLQYLSTGHHPVTGKDFPAARAYYHNMFSKVFEGQIVSTNVAKALASYERTANSFQAPFDRWLQGDDSALTVEQKRGMLVFFGRGRCADCHSPPHFSDSDFHNLGVPNAGFERRDHFPHNREICGGIVPEADPGRAEVPSLRSSCSDVGRFKTPTLRNVELTAPYMHNGAYGTLNEAVRHYESVAKGFITPIAGSLDPDLRETRVGDGGGSPGDVTDLTAFLRALTGSQLRGPTRGISPPQAPEEESF